MSEPTRWRSIWLLFFCGCTLSLHIGKLPPSLPLLTETFSLRLSQAGNLVATFSILIGIMGLFLGTVVARFGFVAFATVGLMLAGVGSVIGATAGSFSLLIFSRTIEGLGWIVAVVAIPSLMARLATASDKPVVLGIWGAFLPVGAGTMLLLAPILQASGGWRLSWWVAAFASIVAAVILLEIGRRNQPLFSPLKQSSIITPWFEIKSIRAWGLFFSFFFYSFQFMALTSFLPTVFMAEGGISLASASRWTALVVLTNATGNLLAGQLIRRGVPVYQLLSLAAVSVGIAALITLLPLPIYIRICSAVVFAVMGGLIPGTLFATASRIATKPAATGILIGFMLQAAGLGQWLGPMLLTRLVEATGLWWAGGLFLMLMASMGAIAAIIGFRTLPAG
ncbi:MAG: MFS transporter [Granulosicoccaceae bacterium]